MAQFNIVVDWTLQWEGGLSRAKTDYASKYPAPCTFTYKGVTANDWHTNKGIQWVTFKTYAQQFGYAPNCENFFAMPYELWQRIAKKVYWDAYGLDSLNSQAIANLLFQSAWGSGLGGSLQFWNGYFQTNSTTQSGITKHVQELLKTHNEKALFDSMWKARLNWLLSRKGYEANFEGWKNRANSLKELSEPYLTGSGEGINFANLGIAGLLIFLAWKTGEKLAEK